MAHHPTGLIDDGRISALLSAGVIAVVPRAVPTAVEVAVEFGNTGSGWASAIVFNLWLRRKMRERRLTQRQLAAMAGVSHATVSRLLKGDRRPTLETATRLAQAIAGSDETDDVVRYLAAENAAAMLPTRRVEAALRGDASLDDSAVRYLMQEYLRRRVAHGSVRGQLRDIRGEAAD